jgi:hypothetical protein
VPAAFTGSLSLHQRSESTESIESIVRRCAHQSSNRRQHACVWSLLSAYQLSCMHLPNLLIFVRWSSFRTYQAGLMYADAKGGRAAHYIKTHVPGVAPTDDHCMLVEMGSRAAFVVAFLLRAIYAGTQILTKAAFDEGMNTSVFVFYRHLTGILFLVPIAFVLER